jgi:hypothetical protein
MGRKKKLAEYAPLNLVLEFNETNDLNALYNSADFKKVIYDEMHKIFEFISKNKPEKMDIFKLNNLGITVTLPKLEYKKALEKTIQYYTEQEDYIKCSELDKLKNKI